MSTDPLNLPRSRFGRRSTAEEVTAGIDLRGKTAVVTGCSSGLGLETMRVLSLRGADVIGAARTLEAARTACAKITGNTRPIACELTDLDSIAKCADELSSAAPPLDMLICNAGIMMLPKLEQIRGSVIMRTRSWMLRARKSSHDRDYSRLICSPAKKALVPSCGSTTQQ